MRRPSGTSATPRRAIHSGAFPSTDCPATATSPSRAGTRPMIACSVVDFPAPFGPIRPTISPPATSSERFRTAGTAPYRTSRFRTERAGASLIVHEGRLAEVGSRDVEVGADLGGSPLGEGAALVEDDDPVADAHDERHVVVDQEDARVVVVAHGADDPREFRNLGLWQAGRRLVQQEELRLGGERAGDAEPPLVTVGEHPGRHALLLPEPEQPEQLVRPPAGAARAGADAERGDLHVLAHGEVTERPAVLERARQAGSGAPVCAPARDPAVAELDATARWEVETGDDVHERRLSCAVRPDQADDLVAMQLQRHVLERADAAEGP